MQDTILKIGRQYRSHPVDVAEVHVCISLYGGLLLLGKALPREI